MRNENAPKRQCANVRHKPGAVVVLLHHHSP